MKKQSYKRHTHTHAHGRIVGSDVREVARGGDKNFLRVTHAVECLTNGTKSTVSAVSVKHAHTTENVSI